MDMKTANEDVPRVIKFGYAYLNHVDMVQAFVKSIDVLQKNDNLNKNKDIVFAWIKWSSLLTEFEFETPESILNTHQERMIFTNNYLKRFVALCEGVAPYNEVYKKYFDIDVLEICGLEKLSDEANDIISSVS